LSIRDVGLVGIIFAGKIGLILTYEGQRKCMEFAGTQFTDGLSRESLRLDYL